MGLRNVCDKMFSKPLIENISKPFYNDWYENQLLLNVWKTVSEQTFTNIYKHCQSMLFKHFMCTVYLTFHDECFLSYFTNV